MSSATSVKSFLLPVIDAIRTDSPYSASWNHETKEWNYSIEDDLHCERLVEKYLNDSDPHKHDHITLEELATREDIKL